jgi:pimeloyl-ACP methyl ester carboxylesterase
MTRASSHRIDLKPRLHYLQWNPSGRTSVVLLHGNSANAWWWEPVAREMPSEFRLLALDQRGHGDSEWVRPAAYTPADYAHDLVGFLRRVMGADDRPILVGHSMGGLSTLAFAAHHGSLARAAVVMDAAMTSSRGRDRFLRRLKSLPLVTYPDLNTAKARFRLMPNEGHIPAAILQAIAEKSLVATDDGRWTMKFDRESFFGGDGINPMEAIKKIHIPTLLLRAEMSRIMTAEAAAAACAANPRVRLVTVPAAHHHLLLEKPAAVAKAIREFVASLPRSG